MIAPEHRQAEALFSRAELLDRSQVEETRRLYLEAAGFERSALEKTPHDQSRTRGILAVSSVALLVRGGEAARAREEIADLLGDPSLPERSRRELGRILLDLGPANAGLAEGQVPTPRSGKPDAGSRGERTAYRRAGWVRDSGSGSEPGGYDEAQGRALRQPLDQDELVAFLEPLLDAAFLGLSRQDRSTLTRRFGLQGLFPGGPEPDTRPASSRPSSGAAVRRAADRLAKRLEAQIGALRPATERDADRIRAGLRFAQGRLDLA